MRLEHHLVGGYVRYISPHIIIIINWWPIALHTWGWKASIMQNLNTSWEMKEILHLWKWVMIQHIAMKGKSLRWHINVHTDVMEKYRNIMD